MTIDEAIEHAKEVAQTCDDGQCAADHTKLAEWLRQARGAEKAAEWYTKRIAELEAETAKLAHQAHDYKNRFARLKLENENMSAWKESACDLLRDMGSQMHEISLDEDWAWDLWNGETEPRIPGYEDRLRELEIEVDE